MATATDRLSGLRQALHDSDDRVACTAARELAKLSHRAVEAVEDLIAMAKWPWKFGCPQRFPDAIEALLKIAPSDARLVQIIRDTICCSNYGIQKTSVLALLKIGTTDAIDTLYNIDRYWLASPKSAPFKKLMYKVISDMETQGLNSLINDSVDARVRLVDWLEGRQQGPSCPNCAKQLRSRLAKQCFSCGMDWHGSESKQ